VLHAVGRQLCQHVVGMNPQSIGELGADPPPLPHESEDETRLVQQEYMLDTTLSVGAVLQQHGLTVRDFVRYECGGPDVASARSAAPAETITVEAAASQELQQA